MINDTAFVAAFLDRLAGGQTSVDLASSVKARDAYLSRVDSFVAELPPSMGVLRLTLAYHQLRLDVDTGALLGGTQLDSLADRLVAYLALPRNRSSFQLASYTKDHRGSLIDIRGCGCNLLLPTVTERQDSELVALLTKHLLWAGTNAPLQLYIDSDQLARWQAEASLLNGHATHGGKGPGGRPWVDAEAVASRTELSFCEGNPEYLPSGTAPVELQLWVKNVPSVTVNVFEINTTAVYQVRSAQAPNFDR
jgi:hypothetical protein